MPKSEMIYVRMDEKMKSLIRKRIAEIPGLKMSQFIRECIEKKLSKKQS